MYWLFVWINGRLISKKFDGVLSEQDVTKVKGGSIWIFF